MFLSLALALLSMVALVAALANPHTEVAKRDDTTTTTSSLSKSDTIVWVTITTNGNIATVKSVWSQEFMTTYTEATVSASSGDIGMGSLSGSAGSVRSYEHTTITNGAAGPAYVGGAVGVALVALGML